MIDSIFKTIISPKGPRRGMAGLFIGTFGYVIRRIARIFFLYVLPYWLMVNAVAYMPEKFFAIVSTSRLIQLSLVVIGVAFFSVFNVFPVFMGTSPTMKSRKAFGKYILLITSLAALCLVIVLIQYSIGDFSPTEGYKMRSLYDGALEKVNSGKDLIRGGALVGAMDWFKSVFYGKPKSENK